MSPLSTRPDQRHEADADSDVDDNDVSVVLLMHIYSIYNRSARPKKLSLSLSLSNMCTNTCETTMNCLGETKPPAPATVTFVIFWVMTETENLHQKHILKE